MSNHTVTAGVSVLLAIIGVAIIAVLVSGGSRTGPVLGAFGEAIKKMICVALSPVTGGNCGSDVFATDSVFITNPGDFKK